MGVAHIGNFHHHNEFLPQNRFITQIDSFESLILLGQVSIFRVAPRGGLVGVQCPVPHDSSGIKFSSS